MPNMLKKYLEDTIRSNRFMEDDEDDYLKRKEKEMESARLLEDVGSITGDFSRLGTLGGTAPKSSLPEYFSKKARKSEADLGAAKQDSSYRRKELLSNLDRLRGIEREEKSDRYREEEKDYRRERDRKADDLSEMQFGAKAQEMKNRQAQRVNSEESKKKKEIEKFYRDTVVAPSIKSAEKLGTASVTLEGQLSTIRKYLAEGDYEKARKQALGTLKAVNSLVTGSPDAVALGEVDILAPELTRSFKNLVTGGSLSDVVGYVNRIQDKVDAVKGTSQSLRKKAQRVLGGESYFDVYGDKESPKKQKEPKAGDRFVDPDTGETMVWVEED